MSDPIHHEHKQIFQLLFEYSEWIDTPEVRELEDSWTKLIHDFLDEKLQDILTHKPCPHPSEAYRTHTQDGEHRRRCVLIGNRWRMIDEAKGTTR